MSRTIKILSCLLGILFVIHAWQLYNASPFFGSERGTYVALISPTLSFLAGNILLILPFLSRKGLFQRMALYYVISRSLIGVVMGPLWFFGSDRIEENILLTKWPWFLFSFAILFSITHLRKTFATIGPSLLAIFLMTVVLFAILSFFLRFSLSGL